MNDLEDLKQATIQEAYKLPDNRRKFGSVPAEIVVPDGPTSADVKIRTPNAPKLVAPLVDELGFRPTFELDEGSQLASAIFVGQLRGNYRELKLLWMPETTANPGEFLPQEAFQLEKGKRHDDAWLAGTAVGSS